jgi:hypothetical protein
VAYGGRRLRLCQSKPQITVSGGSGPRSRPPAGPPAGSGSPTPHSAAGITAPSDRLDELYPLRPSASPRCQAKKPRHITCGRSCRTGPMTWSSPPGLWLPLFSGVRGPAVRAIEPRCVGKQRDPGGRAAADPPMNG